MQQQLNWFALDWLRTLCVRIESGDEEQQASAGGIRPRTIRGTLKKIERLSRALSTVDAKTFSLRNSQRNTDIIRQCLEHLPSFTSRRKVASYIYSLYQHMKEQHGYPKLKNPKVLDIRDADPRVDANLVTHSDFARITDLFKVSSLIRTTAMNDHPDMPMVARLIVTLGFRAGLRSEEVWGLQLCDLIGNHQALELIIRDNEIRTLKPANARRRLPLHILLSPNELKELLQWRTRVQGFADTTKTPLFALDKRRNQRRPPDKARVFANVSAALKTGTQDASVRFHTLRHSAANWWLIALYSHHYGVPKEQLHFCPDSADWVTKNASVLHWTFLGTGEMTPSILYAVARNCGHASPETTLRSYIHTMDIIVAHVRNQKAPQQPASIARTAGKSLQQLNRVKSKTENSFKRYLLKPIDQSKMLQRDENRRTAQNTNEECPFESFRETLLSVPLEQNLYDAISSRYQQNVKQLMRIQSRTPVAFSTQSNTESSATVSGATALPTKPFRHEALYEARQLFIKTHRFVQQTGNEDLVRRAVWAYATARFDRYATARFDRHATVTFSEEKTAHDYLTFMREIGIPFKRLRVRLLHGRNKSRPWCSAALTHWSESLSTPKRYLQLHALRDRHAYGAQGYLSIDIERDGKAIADATHFAMRLLYIQYNVED